MKKQFRMSLSRKLTLFTIGALFAMWLAMGTVLLFNTSIEILNGSSQKARLRIENYRADSFIHVYSAYCSAGREDIWIQSSHGGFTETLFPVTNRYETSRYMEYVILSRDGVPVLSTMLGIRLQCREVPFTSGIDLMLDGLSPNDFFKLSKQIDPSKAMPPLTAVGRRDGNIFWVDTLTVGPDTYSTGRTGGTDQIDLSIKGQNDLPPDSYILTPSHLDTLKEWELLTDAAARTVYAGGGIENADLYDRSLLDQCNWAYAVDYTTYYANFSPDSIPIDVTVVIISTPLKTALQEHASVLLLTLALVPLLGLLFSWIIQKMVVTPLKKTQIDFDRVAALDFRGCEGDIFRRDEIGDLNRNIRKMAAELKTRWDDERALEQRRQEFVAAASHELKTPLALLSGYTEAVAQSIGDRDRYLAAMEGEIDRMNVLVMELLDQTRLERMEQLAKAEQVDLTALVKTLLDQMAPLFDGLSLQVLLSPGVSLSGDISLMERAIGNLLSNAAKYCRPGGRVEVSLEHGPHGPIFQVENQADPIPDTELPRLFEPFYRGDKARDRSGSGMGLTIAHKIFTLHHLECRVENTATGVRFTVFPAS